MKKLFEIKEKWRLLTRRTRAIYITATVVTILAIAGGITAAVLILKGNGDNGGNANVQFARKYYYYAVDADDENGIVIDGTWRQGIALNKFALATTTPNRLSLDENNVLKATSSAEEGAEYCLQYAYEGKIAAVLYVDVVKNANFVTGIGDLKGIPENSDGIYIMKTDLTALGNISIKNFRGRFYGNHHTLDGFIVGRNGGLFDSLDGAYVYSLNMTGVTGEISFSEAGNVGALVNSAYSSTVQYCSAEGGYTIGFVSSRPTELTEIVCAGGMFGFLDSAERKTDDTDLLMPVNRCNSKINITISRTNAAMYAGGMIGRARNVNVMNSASAGAVNVFARGARVVYAGGIAGSLESVVSHYASGIHCFASATALTGYSDVTVESRNDGEAYSVFVGGAFGKVFNHNLVGVTVKGTVKVDSDKAAVFAGGAVGYAQNSPTNVSITMYFNKVDVKSPPEAVGNGKVKDGDAVAYLEGKLEQGE